MIQTIKQLEKEIERIEKLKEEMSSECWISSQLRINLFKAKAQLQNLKDVWKMINEMTAFKFNKLYSAIEDTLLENPNHMAKTQTVKQILDDIYEELKQKIQGETGYEKAKKGLDKLKKSKKGWGRPYGY